MSLSALSSVPSPTLIDKDRSRSTSDCHKWLVSNYTLSVTPSISMPPFPKNAEMQTKDIARLLGAVFKATRPTPFAFFALSLSLSPYTAALAVL